MIVDMLYETQHQWLVSEKWYGLTIYITLMAKNKGIAQDIKRRFEYDYKILFPEKPLPVFKVQHQVGSGQSLHPPRRGYTHVTWIDHNEHAFIQKVEPVLIQGDADDPPEGFHYHALGGGLVQDTAFVDATAYVGPWAVVRDTAQVRAKAKVRGHSVISGNASVWGHALVLNSSLQGKAQVRDNAWVFDSELRDQVVVGGYSKVEDSFLYETATVKTRAKVTQSSVGAGFVAAHTDHYDRHHEPTTVFMEPPSGDVIAVTGNLYADNIMDRHALEQKQKELDHLQETLQKRELDLLDKEAALSSRDASLASRESSFYDREATLSDRESRVDSRETDLASKEADLETWRDLSFEKERLRQEKERLDKDQDILDEQESHYLEKLEELENKESQLRQWESRLEIAENMAQVKDVTVALKEMTEQMQEPVMEAKLLRERRLLEEEKTLLENLKIELEDREKRVEEVEGRTFQELAADIDINNTEDPMTSDQEAPKNAAIKNTATAASQAFMQGAKLAGANKLNQMITQAAKRLLVESGVPEDALDNPAVEAVLKLTTPFILHYVCEKFPQVVPGADVVKEGAEAAISAATFQVLMPLLEKIGPDLMAIRKEAEAIVTDAPGLSESPKENIVDQTVNAKVEEPVGAPA